MGKISNEQKAREIAENAKLPLSLNETDEVSRAVNTCSKKGYFKTAVKYGASVMAQWKDEQHKQEKQQWIDKACKWLAENDSYAVPTNVKVDRLREHLNNIK